ncbi:hypothetical protein BLS_005878 [Venturia inaequalis]|uniref:Alkaline phytoceramidase n=1 Tax=Venturia inaequalis TaxID=5025 RepID=A0A8H3YNZ9_VENIN|nr:hypothetical protein EG327_001004 [Venturia inaequalis]KAE9967960.1 hypothetical protein EG328_007844 [Venturia inaequalis]KAE9968395.1 hypothetical protein BLS_005878 [Venturia inaequalis]RDI81984.1 hypothetical protein Vi05172_g8022 [Venturia inaequalis]
MLSWLPSLAYPPAGDGYWSPITSTLNWCEEARSKPWAFTKHRNNHSQDYYATPYVAEIVNTLTNSFFVYLGAKGIYNTLKEGHEKIFLTTFCGYLLVGTGSIFFHMTLKYPWQLVDELSMIYTTCIMFYATFSHRQTTTYAAVLGVALLVLSVLITTYYHYLQDPTFHQISYAILTAVVLLRAMWVMEVNIRPSISAREKELRENGSMPPAERAELERQDKRDLKIVNDMWIMVYYGLGTFLGGFFIWNLDNIFCSSLISWRHQIGLPWGILLEGHGWWHVMTGIGAYFYITWGIWLRQCLNNKQDQCEMYWPSTFSFPVIRNIRSPSDRVSNGVAQNGAAVKKEL